MTRLGVVSDTHLPRFGRRLPRALTERLRDERVDGILHLGDHTAAFVVDELATIAAVEAVAGNNDPDELVVRFGRSRILAVDGLRIGLTHGHLGPGRTTPDRAVSTFPSDAVDVVAFGHSHRPLWQRRDEVWLLNPGSPTDRRREPTFSFAILEIGPAGPHAQIVRYLDRSV